MKSFLLASAAIVFLASPAFAQSPAPKPSVTERTGVNSVVRVSPSTQDFVTEAAVGDMFEIESSKLAQQKATDTATKDFAAKMIEDHTKTSTELKRMVSGGKVKAKVPAAMDSSHKSMMDKLVKLNGDDFNKKYHDDQGSAHKSAVGLFERYSKGGKNPGLKDWAGKTLPTLKDHLKMAQDLDK